MPSDPAITTTCGELVVFEEGATSFAQGSAEYIDGIAPTKGTPAVGADKLPAPKN